MMAFFRSRYAVLMFSGAAMLSFMGRTFIDYGYVFPEFGVPTSMVLPITAGMLAFYGGWLWALVAAAHEQRKGFIAILIYNLLLLVFGVSTFTTLCPSPCETAWPTGEILMWSNVIIGIIATFATISLLLAPSVGTVQEMA